MAKPTTRQELVEYALRRLGAPVLEINVADEQLDDILDDTIQYFQERHYDGVIRTYLKYQFTEDDISRGKGDLCVGVTSTTPDCKSTNGASSNQFTEESNYIKLPPHIIGVERVFPLHAPCVTSIQVLRRADVSRAKLYYLRERTGKATRLKQKFETLPEPWKAEN